MSSTHLTHNFQFLYTTLIKFYRLQSFAEYYMFQFTHFVEDIIILEILKDNKTFKE